MSAVPAIRNFRGVVLAPADADYESTRRVWNGAFDRRPAMIAQCLDAEDVRAALAHAHRHELSVAVRGGGHSLAGHSTCEGGIVLDLRRMNRITIDTNARAAVVGPGCTWADFDGAARPHGLATPGGDTSTVGVAGLTLGGGLGWLTRMYGMTSDNLIGAEIVTAEGERLRVDADSHPELFWALRGGGGNFGVVTALVFRLYALPPTIVAGALAYPVTAAPEVLGRIVELTPDLPDEVSWAAAFNSAVDGRPTLEIRLCYVGAPDERAAAALARLRQLGTPLRSNVGPMSYPDLQRLTDSNAPAGMGYASASEWLRRLGPDSIGSLANATRHATSPMSIALINPLGGAVARRAADATSFAYRHAAYAVTIVAGWASAAEPAEPHREWARRLWRSLLPDSAGGGYVNILGDEGPERVRSAYGERTYARLVAVKDRYDPRNLFRHNQNIRPSPSP